MSAAAPLGPIHHVGYVVADLDAGVAALAQTFDVTVTHREVMEAQGVEAVMCEGAGGAIELIRPLDPEGAIARFMEKRGEGFHHVAMAVPDLDATLAALAGRRRRADRPHAAGSAWGAIWWPFCTRDPASAC